jgi:hypothetical protein
MTSLSYSSAEELRCDLQAIQEGADPDYESPDADIDIQASLEGVVNRGERQGRSQGTVKRGSQQAAKSDQRGGTAEGKARDNKDETEAEHNPPCLPTSLDPFPKLRNWA